MKKWAITYLSRLLTNLRKSLADGTQSKRLLKINLKSWKVRAGAAAAVLIVSGSIYYYAASPVYIVIDGQKVGLVSNVESAKRLVEQVLSEQGQPLGLAVKTEQKIEFKKAWAKGSASPDETLTKEELSKRLNVSAEGYALEIAGAKVAVLPTEADVDQVLEDLKKYYTQPSESKKFSSVEIAGDYSVVKTETQPSKVQTREAVLELLKQGKQDVKEYTVEENDSWWLIARKNNMLTKEVLAGNPDLPEDTVLQPGQKIKLVTVTPYLTVITKGEYTASEIIPFDVITKTDYNLASGKTRVEQEGSDGSKVVTYSFVEENGQIKDKQVLDEKIIAKPLDQVIAKGPAKVVIASRSTGGSTLSRGSGVSSGFIWPLRGAITSYYGWRSRGFHNGIDIDGYTGDPIKAAASGRVISAGWNGSYGLSVLIDHGNGIQTRYSHASKINVSVGQNVAQGQTIAQVGSTGNSTGSHLDFEVLVNGSNVNPLKYLP